MLTKRDVLEFSLSICNEVKMDYESIKLIVNRI